MTSGVDESMAIAQAHLHNSVGCEPQRLLCSENDGEFTALTTPRQTDRVRRADDPASAGGRQVGSGFTGADRSQRIRTRQHQRDGAVSAKIRRRIGPRHAEAGLTRAVIVDPLLESRRLLIGVAGAGSLVSRCVGGVLQHPGAQADGWFKTADGCGEINVDSKTSRPWLACRGPRQGEGRGGEIRQILRGHEIALGRWRTQPATAPG